MSEKKPGDKATYTQVVGISPEGRFYEAQVNGWKDKDKAARQVRNYFDGDCDLVMVEVEMTIPEHKTPVLPPVVRLKAVTAEDTDA